MPFRQFVLKVCSRCDLACDHCYVYEHADQSWRAKPKVISEGTVTIAAERIAEHARRHALQGVRIVLHGGEPLLAGRASLEWICTELRRVIEGACPLDLRLHTNGVTLDQPFLEMFAEQRVRIGISLDGDRAANDRHRRYASGRSSYDRATGAIDRLRSERYRPLYAGLLCTVDVRNDPAGTFDALAAFQPPVIDFLLPHATWDSPPPEASNGTTPYADWLIAVFDRWKSTGQGASVRLFESIITTTYGGRSGTEALGLAPSDVLVIEADGSIEQVDSLKVAYDGAPGTGLDIRRHSLDEAAGHPGVVARQQGLAGLSATCRRCPVVTSCGGGLYTHRYSSGKGFNNPSVYCDDLMKLITHVRSSVRPAAARLPFQSLPTGDFDSLATGYGTEAAVEHLLRAQRGIVRTLLGVVRQRGGEDIPSGAWDVLARLDAMHSPYLDEVLGHPYIRAWGARFLRPAAGSPDRQGLTDSDVQHLGSAAAAAAIRAGLPVELEVPVRDGFLHLPTLGRLGIPLVTGTSLTVATGTDWFSARLPEGDRVIKVNSPEPQANWEPVRLLRADGLTLRLEDTDPYRDCHQWPAAQRLPAAEVHRWQLLYRRSWELITAEFPGYAPGLAAGLTTVTPLANKARDREISATARQAFGSVAVALPDSADTLALLLLHEFQHVKLGAVLDLFDLYDRNDARLFYAPWKDAPRPLEALLQGTYAHIAVTEYWRARSRRPAPQAQEAAARFALWRAQTSGAAETLAASRSLTALGARFVDGIRATLGQWLGEPVPAAAASRARQWADEHRSRWPAAAGPP
ncbi:MAG TPA: FxsB family cyclophane-forming radical SAM/SPASM peptide maturase [Trebonia sp.]|nr:FxsB family cyclophane-forming radical SAM/SPASM peptide maturase [Trebonia sp.]